jgi:OmcA/MtrC family decaheme c-type cytochrome
MLRRGIALAITAGSLVLTSSQPTATRVVAPRGGDGGPAQHSIYPATSKEFYLAQDQFDFARPGYHIKINSVTIGADRKPVADVTLTDDLGAPLDRLGVQTPGVCTVSYVLAWYNPATRDYTSYRTRTQTSPITGKSAIQATSDSGGTIKDIDIGHFTYTFGTVLPAGFDQTKTHTVGVYGRRTMPADIMNGKVYIDNFEFDFRPDTQPVTVKWDEIQENNACNQCHDPLEAHGEVRQDAKLCVLCHSPQTSDPDTGNTVDMRVFIHKIHRGSSLPSVIAGTPYHIVGNAQNDNDYSTVAFPQDIRNCQNCHEGRNPAAKPSQSDVWYTKPARAPCGACHDAIDWVTGENHAGGPQADDSACASCHVPQGDQEYDAGIRTAHTPPYRSKQLKGLNATILTVDNVGPGKKPVVTFKLTENDGTVLDPKNFGASSTVNFLLGGPTVDYGTGQAPPAQPFRENAAGATFNGTVATYTFTNAIPATASGTWALAIEARRTITLNPAPNKGPATYTEGAVNPIKYIAVTDGAPVPRRSVVVLDSPVFTVGTCNKCHDRLATTFSHGGQRIAIEECDICHNPNATDVNRRPADGSKNPPESILLKRMIHRIHSGENLTQEYTVYGFGGNPTHFNEVRYPGDRKDCLQCHTSTSTYNLPLPTGTIFAITERDFFSPQGPGTSACLGCHDNVDAAAHAYLNTVFTPFMGEACASCHGDGKDWDVVKVHAR